MGGLSAHQIWICAVAERVSSSLSVTGILAMFLCYFSFKRFRTLLSNRILMFASLANLACNTATLMGNSGLADLNSSVCQAQAFLLEWFMQTDPMFGACMALDVYLVVFRRWTYSQVERIFKWYIPFCFGLPFVPALVCLVYRGKNSDKIYGSAGIWCWIDNEYAYVRIYSYYGPVWIYLASTFAIYIRVGFEVFYHRSALRAFHTPGRAKRTPGSEYGGGSRSRRSLNTSAIPAFTGTRTTEVQVTTAANKFVAPPQIHLESSHSHEGGNVVNITANERAPHRRALGKPRGWYNTLFKGFNHLDKITIAYCKCAGLFAITIIVTWAPSSANRIYGLNHPKKPSFALNVAAAAVLPLQGFWNSTIFFWTSWHLVKKEYHERRRLRLSKKEQVNSLAQIRMAERGQRGVSLSKGGDTESTKDVLEQTEEMAIISGNTRNSSVEALSARSLSSP